MATRIALATARDGQPPRERVQPPARRGRVTMLLENFPYPQDPRVRQEAEALTRAGYDVTVLAPRRSRQRRCEEIAGVTVRRYWLPQASESIVGYVWEYGVAHVQLLLRTAREVARGADIVHLHNPPDTLIAIGLLARTRGCAVVFDQHDSMPELYEDKFGSRVVTRLLLAVQRLTLRSASAVIVTNESQRRLVLERSGRSAVGLGVVRNGPRRCRPRRPAQRRTGRLADPRLIYVGELGPQDGVLTLADLLAEPRLSQASLTVVGDGSCRAALAARCAALGVDGRARFTGWVEHDEVFRLLDSADIGIDPAPCNALNHISTMIKIAEYLSVGLPVVAYRLRETEATARDSALYARCNDVGDLAAHVVRLARDEALREQLGEAGLARSRELLWERSEQVLLDVYGGLDR